ncbi:hypothetical protein ACLMJK_004659 [Lecanora helva]
MAQCCLTGFKWDGERAGTDGKLSNNNTYITGSNKDVAILMIHDIFGWTFPNLRLLADHFAEEIGATVFNGDVVSEDTIMDPQKRESFDFQAFFKPHSKESRYPEIAACARALKEEHKFKKVGAMGYCWGGWGVFQLGAKGENLVDAISTAHPSWLTKEEVNVVSVPVQIIAPEQDPQLTPELKEHLNATIPKLGLEYDYQYFPGARHGLAARCDRENAGERRAMERAKNAAVTWFAQMLHRD